MPSAKFFAVIALSATLCAAAPQPEVGRPFDMKPNEVVTVDGLTITFEGVEADSRCPTGETCMWAGDAAAAFTLERAPGASVHRTLHTNGRFERQANYDRFVISLDDIKPYPKAGSSIARDEYRATLIVTRR